MSGEVRDGARRAGLAAAAVGVVAAGLVVTRAGSGPFVGAVGDALYAVLSYLLVGLALPRARAWVVAGVALGACTLIELLQLTGLPAAMVDLWGPARYLLGTTFQAVDLAAYAIGVTAAAAGDRAARKIG